MKTITATYDVALQSNLNEIGEACSRFDFIPDEVAAKIYDAYYYSDSHGSSADKMIAYHNFSMAIHALEILRGRIFLLNSIKRIDICDVENFSTMSI